MGVFQMLQIYKRPDHNGIGFTFIVLSLIFSFSLGTAPRAFSQGSTTPRKDRDPSVLTVESLLQQPSGFSTGFSEKSSARLGDRVSIAVLKIFKNNELEDAENIRKFLPIIRSAFLYPADVPAQYRKPKITLPLLTRLERKVTDVELKHQISEVARFVTEQTRPH
jgi:hypothetical protein